MIRLALLSLLVGGALAAPQSPLGRFNMTPPVCDRPNEALVHTDCEMPCRLKDAPQMCTLMHLVTGECQCKNGFFRAENGVCVSYEQCSQDKPNTSKPLPQEPICKRAHEEMRSDLACAKTCKEKDKHVIDCFWGHYSPKCACAHGFYRADNGECVTYEQCSKDKPRTSKPQPEQPICKRANEVVVHSHENCFPTCAKRGSRPRCPRIHDPIGSCQCRGGYLRAENGECVTIDKCDENKPIVTTRPAKPTCTRANEVLRSDIGCVRSCSNKDKKLFDCAWGRSAPRCACARGFYEADNGDCVTYEQCDKDTPTAVTPPAKPTCKVANEVLRSDLDCAKTCVDKNKNLGDCFFLQYPEQCACARGFYRSENGECVTYEQCDKDKPTAVTRPAKPTCKRLNEVLRSDPACWKTCKDKDKFVNDCESMKAAPECACADGFYRSDYYGECVKYEHCNLDII